MSKITKSLVRRYIFEYLMIIIGSALYGFSTVLFVFSSGVVLGGTSGVSLILSSFLSFSPATIMAIINLLLLGLAYIILGRQMAIKTFVGSILTALFSSLFEALFKLSEPLLSSPYVSGVIAAAIIALASGIMFYVDSSSGGTDIVALIVQKFSKIKIGRALLITDVLIVIVAGIVSGLTVFFSSFLGFLVKVIGIDLVIGIIRRISQKNLTRGYIKMKNHAYFEYLSFDGAEFFTAVFLPKKDGKFPVVISRTPYVDATISEKDALLAAEKAHEEFLSHGYAVVFQHCRGQGLSSGEFIPYISEREDGLFLQEWIRKQSFYQGELYLCGASYGASLHYTTAPFASDIRACALEVQDSDRYRICYRNGQMRKGHAHWHFMLYKRKSGLDKQFNIRSFSTLPLANISEALVGEVSEDFEEMLKAPLESDPFWQTRYGGIEARDAERNSDVPILFTSGFNDFYIGGMFKMWQGLPEKRRKRCAFLVSPYHHTDAPVLNGMTFKEGRRTEHFGGDYRASWFDYVRLGTKLPYECGKISYYRVFENGWDRDFYKDGTQNLTFKLGEGEKSFIYEPMNPPAYAPEGTRQERFDTRSDVISLLYEASEDLFIKGRMSASLLLKTDAEDSSFYMNISIRKPDGDYVLRHDITSLSYQLKSYIKGEPLRLEFSFDEHAFLLRRGEQLRIDISSCDDNTYVPHTNKKGPYHLQSASVAAHHTIYLDKSTLTLPVEIKA